MIPVYNSAAQLRLCLEALLENNLTTVEIVVIDDASRDSSDQVVSNISHPTLHYIRLEQQGGPAAARNEGFRRAKYPYLLFLDADIVLPKNSLEWLRETLELYSHRPEVAGVLGVYSETIPWKDFLTNFKNLSTCYLYQTTDTLSPFLHGPILCLKRKVLAGVGGFDPKLSRAEDFRLGILLGSQGYRFVIDRRIQGTHLKRHTLLAILREDWLRIRYLWRAKLKEGKQGFYYRALRWRRLLSIGLAALTGIYGTLALFDLSYGKIALVLLTVFFFCNLFFLRYCQRHRGMSFALQCALFLLFEMSWAGISVALCWLRLRRPDSL